MGILLSDEEMREAYGIEGEYGTMERVAKAQLKKAGEAVRDMPHGTVHCDIVKELLKEVEG